MRTGVDAFDYASGMHSISYHDDVLVHTAAGWRIAGRSHTTVHSNSSAADVITVLV